MRIAVAGCRDWGDYFTLIRKLTIEIEDWATSNPEDNRLTFIHTGQAGAENMVTEYVGKTQTFLKQKGWSVNDIVFYTSSEDRDTELLNSGVSKAIVFMTKDCKRCWRFAKIAEETIGIPVVTITLD